ncbi:MAG: glycosyltransferase family 4 protein [Muribaculum sp.]|nr:glycosyltransferase family 4 protein [Muribaculum sp.]
MRKKVLVVATSRKTHGGIATVVKAFEKGNIWQKYHCKWIEAHIDGTMIKKILYLIRGYVQYIILLPFYDIVHVHMSAGISAKRKIGFVRIAKMFRKPVVVHLHCGNQVEDSWSNQMTYIFTKADVGLVLSNCIKEAVKRKTGKDDNLQVCFNPAPEIKFQRDTPRKKYILYSGTIGKNKGYHILIEAFAKIAHKFPDWSVMIAGVGEMNNAISLIAEYGIEDQVKMLGWISGELKDRYYREASIFCLPSFMEGFPMSVLEAWAYGIPVISTPVGGIPDVAIDGDNMMLFDIGDVDGLADKLSDLISNEELREHIGQKSLELADGKFNLTTILKQLDMIYSSL